MLNIRILFGMLFAVILTGNLLPAANHEHPVSAMEEVVCTFLSPIHSHQHTNAIPTDHNAVPTELEETRDSGKDKEIHRNLLDGFSFFAQDSELPEHLTISNGYSISTDFIQYAPGTPLFLALKSLLI